MTQQFENEPLLNETTVAELWELDAGSGFMQELVLEFNLQNQRLMADIIQSADERNDEVLRHSVHTMKGSSANVGANRQAAIALAVENACKAEDYATIRNLMPALTVIAEETEKALRNLLLE